MKHRLRFLVTCSLIAGLSACGGGGSSSKPSPTTSTSSSVSSVVTSSLSSSSISSALSSSSPLSSSSTSAVMNISTKVSGKVYLKDGENENLNIESPETVTVTLSLLDSQEQEVAVSSPKLVNPVGFAIDDGVPFTADIAGNNPKTIVVHISSPGFSDYARRFEFSSSVSVTANLKKLQELTVAPTQVTSISGKAVDGFNVSVNNSNGNQQIIEGDAGSITDLSVSIPQSALPDGTNSVDVTMQAFNPNDLEEAQSFPGAYQDSTGNKLLSVAFNYTDVKTNTGTSLKQIAQVARDERLALQKKSGRALSPMQFAKEKSQKTGETLEPVIINRKIPEASCASLSQLGDANATQAGFQVPVYTYNTTNGLWDLLGYGTLFDETGNLVAADQKIFNCSVTTYVLEIEATNEIFLSNWWNLDYPLIFTQPVKLCADIELRDAGSQPLTGNVLFVTDDDGVRSFSEGSFVTDDNGRVHIEVISLDSGADLSATAYIYNSSFYSAYTPKPITLSTACNVSSEPVVITLPVPKVCKVGGKLVTTSGSPLSNHVVIGANFSGEVMGAIPGFAVTDAEGRYQLSLQCDEKYQIFDSVTFGFGNPEDLTDFEVNVNGSVDFSETSDNGSSVVMNDLVFSPKPLGHVGLLEDSDDQISLLVVYTGTDFPLTYNFAVRDGDDNILKEYSGTVNEADFVLDDEVGFEYALIRIDHNLSEEQIADISGYSAVGEIKDAKGLTSAIYDEAPDEAPNDDSTEEN